MERSRVGLANTQGRGTDHEINRQRETGGPKFCDAAGPPRRLSTPLGARPGSPAPATSQARHRKPASFLVRLQVCREVGVRHVVGLEIPVRHEIAHACAALLIEGDLAALPPSIVRSRHALPRCGQVCVAAAEPALPRPRYDRGRRSGTLIDQGVVKVEENRPDQDDSAICFRVASVLGMSSRADWVRLSIALAASSPYCSAKNSRPAGRNVHVSLSSVPSPAGCRS